MDRTEWHRIVTFQDGLVEMMEKHAKKGRLVYVSGKLQTRKWRKDGEDSDRFSTEILLVPGVTESNSWISQTETVPRRRMATPFLSPPKTSPGWWMTARSPSKEGLPPPAHPRAGSRQVGVGPAIFYAALFESRNYLHTWSARRTHAQTFFCTALRNAAFPHRR